MEKSKIALQFYIIIYVTLASATTTLMTHLECDVHGWAHYGHLPNSILICDPRSVCMYWSALKIVKCKG